MRHATAHQQDHNDEPGLFCQLILETGDDVAIARTADIQIADGEIVLGDVFDEDDRPAVYTALTYTPDDAERLGRALIAAAAAARAGHAPTMREAA